MLNMIQNELHEDVIVETDTEYVEEMVRSSLLLEQGAVSDIQTFSELGMSSKLRGLEMKCLDGAKYYMTITRAV